MPFEIRFRDASLDKLDSDQKQDGGFSKAIVKAFRKRMQAIRSAVDERDFYSMGSLRFEKLKGERKHQHSMRLNDQWRLILEIEGEASNKNKTIWVVAIEDYH